MRRFTKNLSPGALVVAASLLVAVPAQAAGVLETTAATTPRSSIATLSPAALAALQSPAAGQAQPGTTTGTDNGSFFKTKKGAAVLALIGVGFAYTLYSKNHDRVMSQIR